MKHSSPPSPQKPPESRERGDILRFGPPLSLAEVEMRCNPEKILELENVTLVFECEDARPTC